MFRFSGLAFVLLLFCLPLVALAQMEGHYPLNPTQYMSWKQETQKNEKNALSEQRSLSTPPYYREKEQTFSQNHNPLLQKPFRYQREKTEPPSAIEKSYSKRTNEKLTQFGYDLFGVPNQQTQGLLNDLARTSPPSGAVADDFVLGIGDEMEVVFTGQRKDRTITKINSQGLLLIEDFPSIPAAGRTIGQVRLSIENAANSLHNTQAYLSLSRIRQIDVLVIGNVKKPGRQTLTAFHTVLDALMGASGISKSGSLRQIKLVRDGHSSLIDLYALLLHGSTSIDLNLRDGDRIIVPPIGPTIAVAGEVKNPGVFEILPPSKNTDALSLNDMLKFGGGIITPGKNRFMKLEITTDGKETVTEVKQKNTKDPIFSDGSILIVSKGEEKRSGMVELAGHTRRPGLFSLKSHPSLKSLLNNSDILGADIYPLMGVIKRWDKDQLAHKLLSFPPRLVLKGTYDQKLHNEDIIYLFSNAQIRSFSKEPLDEPKEEKEEESKNNKRMVSLTNEQTGVHKNKEETINDPALLSFLQERSAFVRGAVRYPGAYPIAKGNTLDNLLAVAGGVTLEADTNNIEITSAPTERNPRSRKNISIKQTNPTSIMITTGDAVRVNRKFKKIEDKSVLILGEVKNPGRYDLLPGDKVSNLVSRAGGLTQQSYAKGAVFSRKSERIAEEMRFRSQARQIKHAIANAIETDSKDINAGKIAEARALASELENAEGIGRITIEADPTVLKVEPELDMLLQEGDRLFIPRRDLSVRVRGEVLSPASLQFREDKNPRDYIREAGGFTYHADKGRSFILLPDGSAQPLESSVWSHRDMFIPPGSTIVVPRDPEPFDFVQSAKDISQILSNLAVTAIFIDDVKDNH